MAVIHAKKILGMIVHYNEAIIDEFRGKSVITGKIFNIKFTVERSGPGQYMYWFDPPLEKKGVIIEFRATKAVGDVATQIIFIPESPAPSVPLQPVNT